MKCYLEKFPSHSRIARGLGVDPNTVRQWGFRGLIPAEQLVPLEDLAKTLGVKGVSAKEMLAERLRIRAARRAAKKAAGAQPAE